MAAGAASTVADWPEPCALIFGNGLGESAASAARGEAGGSAGEDTTVWAGDKAGINRCIAAAPLSADVGGDGGFGNG